MTHELEVLQAEAEALGIKVDGRWGVDRLRSEIEAAQPDDEPDDELAPVVHRAGGHINYGDGRGWVVEE